jgi:hypothetical protein
MNARWQVLWLLWLATWPAGCSSPVVRDCRLSPVQKSFVLGEPYEFRDSTGTGDTYLLTPGTYQCYYTDQLGDYYEAPFTTKQEYFFRGNRRGGVYVTRGEPQEVRIYTQDNQIGRLYSSYGASGQYGGSGRFVITTRLPEDFLEAIDFSQPRAGEAGHESNPR